MQSPLKYIYLSQYALFISFSPPFLPLSTQGYAYNFGFDFENTIATKFFQGFKSIGQLGLYMSMYEAVKGTEGGVSNYIAYFQSIVSNIMGSTCEWVSD